MPSVWRGVRTAFEANAQAPFTEAQLSHGKIILMMDDAPTMESIVRKISCDYCQQQRARRKFSDPTAPPIPEEIRQAIQE